MLNYFVVSIVPLTILSIVVIGIKEKKDIFKLFIEGVLSGIKVVYNIFPYILAITIAIGLFIVTGSITILIYIIKPYLMLQKLLLEILPLCVLRPISGGASMSAVMDIFKTLGPDSKARKNGFYNNERK